MIMKHSISKLWDAAKAVPRGKHIAFTAYGLQSNKLSTLRSQGIKKRRSKCKISRRKDIIKIRVDIDEINKRHTIEKINKSKIVFLKVF